MPSSGLILTPAVHPTTDTTWKMYVFLRNCVYIKEMKRYKTPEVEGMWSYLSARLLASRDEPELYSLEKGNTRVVCHFIIDFHRVLCFTGTEDILNMWVKIEAFVHVGWGNILNQIVRSSPSESFRPRVQMIRWNSYRNSLGNDDIFLEILVPLLGGQIPNRNFLESAYRSLERP